MSKDCLQGLINVANGTKQGVTEELKATDMMRWIGLMNNIRACAVDADHAGTEALTTVSGSVSVEPISAMVLVKKK